MHEPALQGGQPNNGHPPILSVVHKPEFFASGWAQQDSKLPRLYFAFLQAAALNSPFTNPKVERGVPLQN
jgi:hypothetical protein